MAISWDQILDGIGVSRGRTPSLEQLIELFGGGAKGRSRLAQEISGTKDKKSKEYKTAMRNLQRYTAGEGKQTRKPKQVQTKLRRAWLNEEALKTIESLHGKVVRVSLTAPKIHVSGDLRVRQMTRSEIIAPNVVDEFIDLARMGEHDRAIDALMEGWLDSYGISTSGTIADASDLTIRGNE
jgi:hypothetical protein